MEAENRTASIIISLAVGLLIGLGAGAFNYLFAPVAAGIIFPVAVWMVGGSIPHIEPETAAVIGLVLGTILVIGFGYKLVHRIAERTPLHFDYLIVAFGIAMVPAIFIQSQRDLPKSGYIGNENGPKMTEIMMMVDDPKDTIEMMMDFGELFESLSEEQIAQLEEIDWEEVEKRDRKAGQLTMKGQPLLAQQESLEAESGAIFVTVFEDIPDLPDLQFQKNPTVIDSWMNCYENHCPFSERRGIRIQMDTELAEIITSTHPHLSRKLTSIVSHLKELDQKWASLEKEMEELDQALRKANPAVFELPGFEGLVEKWSAPH
jgi:hypothetical protein